MPREKSIQGLKFGKLTAIRREFQQPRIIHYLCRCECGNETIVKKQSLQDGRTQSCGCNLFKRGSDHKDWRGHGEISADFVSIIRRNAETRNIEFSLPIEWLWELFLKQSRRCALSGVELRFSTTVKSRDGTASLDRIDNNKGYDKDNVRWVHKDVNFMKRALSDKVFLDFVAKIYHNRVK